MELRPARCPGGRARVAKRLRVLTIEATALLVLGVHQFREPLTIG